MSVKQQNNNKNQCLYSSCSHFKKTLFFKINLALPHSNFYIFQLKGYVIVHLHTNHMGSMQAGLLSIYPVRFVYLFVCSDLYQMTTAGLMFHKQENLSLLLNSTHINIFSHT